MSVNPSNQKYCFKLIVEYKFRCWCKFCIVCVSVVIKIMIQCCKVVWNFKLRYQVCFSGWILVWKIVSVTFCSKFFKCHKSFVIYSHQSFEHNSMWINQIRSYRGPRLKLILNCEVNKLILKSPLNTIIIPFCWACVQWAWFSHHNDWLVPVCELVQILLFGP